MLRVSGPDSLRLIQALTSGKAPPPRNAGLRTLTHGQQVIDRALVLYFPSPNSFTGEDMAEFHIHGGGAIKRALARALEALGSAPADAGEFSKRAFLNGRIDLTGAEAIADLIDAETDAQLAQAANQANGGLMRLYDEWTGRLARSLAYLEAGLDFPDEDLPQDFTAGVTVDVAALAEEITGHLADARRGERLREGAHIAILGPPNAGKSSLLNALAEREIAIVSPIAGTTRDIVEAHLDLGGYPVILADTAGLRETSDSVEREGVARALSRAESADLTLILFAADAAPDPAMLSKLGEATLPLLSKCDLAPRPAWATAEFLAISTATGEGLPALARHLSSTVRELAATPADRAPPTRERHRADLAATLESLRRFGTAPAPDLAAEDLRLALRSLGRLTGRVDSENLLDIIFRDFCIGK